MPEDGNCTATLAHLDPFIRGEDTPCDKERPESCQVGDLSGKYGAIPGDKDKWETSYVDLYASTLEGIGAFFGNRSIVFHFPNKTRITCASFKKVEGTATLPPPSGTPTPAPPSPTPSDPVPGAATSLRAGIAGAVVFGAAVMFLL